MSHVIHIGSNVDVLPTLPDSSIDSIVTDPPYGLEFMGKEWDAPWKSKDVRQPGDEGFTKTDNAYGRSKVRYAMGASYGAGNQAMVGFQEWFHQVAVEMYRVLKPGGHVLSFGGSRTYHRMACAIEDAGFEVRDQLMWVYGSGFPKSHNISKALDKTAGVERTEVIGKRSRNVKPFNDKNGWNENNTSGDYEYKAPATEAAKQWDGWGTALKPAHEPIVLARKPLEGTVVDNIRKWGVGGLNIDGCRVGTEGGCAGAGAGAGAGVFGNGLNGTFAKPIEGLGRFPANLMHDGSQEVLDLFPSNAGAAAPVKSGYSGKAKNGIYSDYEQRGDDGATYYADKGSAARFFYCPKASKADRNDGCQDLPDKEWRQEGAAIPEREDRPFLPSKNNHPTVKPTELMRYLCRLITPPGGTVLDPFMGSGSTGRGAILEGFNFIGVELSGEYAAIAEARIKASEQNNK